MDATPSPTECVTPNSRIPAPSGYFRRSASVRVRGEKANGLTSVPGTPFPSIAEREELPEFKKLWNKNRLTLGLNRSRSQASGLNKNQDDDLESVDSFVSNISVATTNSTCEHAYFAKNGTTYSGRSHKYIVHCPGNFSGPEEYLTPTQRANKSIRRLKTLLQLAKEKLREKEQEIFKLTKEVVELKVFKASLRSPNFSDTSTPSEGRDISAIIQDAPIANCDAEVQTFEENDCDVQCAKDFTSDTYNELSPIKTSFYYEEKFDELVKMSPTSPQHGYVEKMSATPDFLLSSLADSGNFDDLASSISLHSKDSMGFTITPELRPLAEENPANEDGRNFEEERAVIVNMYENKLKEKKTEYETELQRVMDGHEEKNKTLILDFERRLKNEESKFEDRWNSLVKSSEEEKMNIVERFECKLEEEKNKYFESLYNAKTSGGKITDMIFGDSYMMKVEEEKAIYENSLEDIKKKFEDEKTMIEKSFDEAMKMERNKFEASVSDIKRESDAQVISLLEKIAQLQLRYDELLPKYEEAVSKSEDLNKENEELKNSLQEQEQRHRSMYLKMYMKGQEAAKLEHADRVVEFAEQAPNRVSVPELLVQLKVTEAKLENLQDKEYRAQHAESQEVCLLSSKEAISLWMLAARKAMYKRLAEAQAQAQHPKERCENDPEATLQFLKSAVYYFLTDRDNHLGHLRAIESILGFNSSERCNIDKFYVNRL